VHAAHASEDLRYLELLEGVLCTAGRHRQNHLELPRNSGSMSGLRSREKTGIRKVQVQSAIYCVVVQQTKPPYLPLSTPLIPPFPHLQVSGGRARDVFVRIYDETEVPFRGLQS
jgi:hypothetical protein